MFSTLGSKEHSPRRRMTSHVYSKSYIQSSEAALAQFSAILFGRLLPLLSQEAATENSTGTEVQSILMATTMDIISAYILGLCNSTNFIQEKEFRDNWLRIYHSTHHHFFWTQELPGLTTLCSRLGIRLYPSFVDAAYDKLREWNKGLCNKTRNSLSFASPELCQPEDEPIVFKAFHTGYDTAHDKTEHDSPLIHESSIIYRDSNTASEVFDLLLAGHENTAITLIYLMWHLSQSLDLQRQLREELLTLSPPMTIAEAGSGCLPNARALDSLPLLHAIIMETLRLHAPVPGPQPRITPYPSCKIGGYDVPGGVRVGGLAHTLHLDKEVFPDPERWNHARWLGLAPDDEHLKQMNRQFWVFGSGGRMCLGSHFALNKIKYITAAIYTNFETSVVNADGLGQNLGHHGQPAGDGMFLKFTSL